MIQQWHEKSSLTLDELELLEDLMRAIPTEEIVEPSSEAPKNEEKPQEAEDLFKMIKENELEV